jgi:hypothetical protein
MTGEEVLALAASHSVRVTFALGDLHLEADHEPAAEALAALRDHKEAVVAELIAATAGERRLHFEDHVATVIRVRRLSRPEAERAAYEAVLIDHLNRTFPNTDPNRCAMCDKSETPEAILLPIGVGIRHAWLHPDCWAPWRERRRTEAVATIARMGIAEPSPRILDATQLQAPIPVAVSYGDGRLGSKSVVDERAI